MIAFIPIHDDGDGTARVWSGKRKQLSMCGHRDRTEVKGCPASFVYKTLISWALDITGWDNNLFYLLTTSKHEFSGGLCQFFCWIVLCWIIVWFRLNDFMIFFLGVIKCLTSALWVDSCYTGVLESGSWRTRLRSLWSLAHIELWQSKPKLC